MNAEVLSAMRQELAKLGGFTARVESTSDPKEFQKQLQPGDILLYGPYKAPKGSVIRDAIGDFINPRVNAFNMAMRVAGPENHTAMYVGRGKVLDVTMPDGVDEFRPMKRDPLKEEVSHAKWVTAFRPNVSAKKREEAVRRFTEMSKRKDLTYDLPAFPGLGIADTSRVAAKANEKRLKQRISEGKYVCSTAVGDAYKGVRFSDRKSNQQLLPRDFRMSDRTRFVAKYVNKGEH